MDFLQDTQTANICMLDELEFEYEDDAFYSELRKQVLQLTADDDDDDDREVDYGRKNPNMAALRQDGRSAGYYNWPRNEEKTAAPAWVANLWKTGNGTGVFIPQIVQTKKKNRPRRKRNERGRTYRYRSAETN